MSTNQPMNSWFSVSPNLLEEMVASYVKESIGINTSSNSRTLNKSWELQASIPQATCHSTFSYSLLLTETKYMLLNLTCIQCIWFQWPTTNSEGEALIVKLEEVLNSNKKLLTLVLCITFPPTIVCIAYFNVRTVCPA